MEVRGKGAPVNIVSYWYLVKICLKSMQGPNKASIESWSSTHTRYCFSVHHCSECYRFYYHSQYESERISNWCSQYIRWLRPPTNRQNFFDIQLFINFICPELKPQWYHSAENHVIVYKLSIGILLQASARYIVLYRTKKHRCEEGRCFC